MESELLYVSEFKTIIEIQIYYRVFFSEKGSKCQIDIALFDDN